MNLLTKLEIIAITPQIFSIILFYPGNNGLYFREFNSIFAACLSPNPELLLLTCCAVW